MKIHLIIAAAILVSHADSTNVFTKFFYKFKEEGEKDENKNLVNTKIKRHVVNQCDEDQLMLHLAALAIEGPDRIITLTTKGDLKKLCTKVNHTLDGVKDELRECFETDQDTLYLRLLNGTQVLNKFLCNNKKFREQYEVNEECYASLHEYYMNCAGPKDWYENANKTLVCENAREITTCNYERTAKLCGLKAAHHMYVFSLEVYKAVLKLYEICNSKSFMEPIVAEPNIAEPQANPHAGNGNRQNFSLLMVILQNMTCLLFAWVLKC